MKKIFKKQNAVDTAMSVAIGGGANVIVDYALTQVQSMATVDQKYIDLGKFAIGVLGSSLIGNKYVKDAMNGIAVVGISNFAKSYMAESEEDMSGVPHGTVGAIGRRQRVLPLKARNQLSNLAPKQQKVSGSASAFIG